MTRCSYLNCNNDSGESNMIEFHPFPKKSNMMECLKWIELCGNENLTIKDINHDTYICSDHFVGVVDENSSPKPFWSLDDKSEENIHDIAKTNISSQSFTLNVNDGMECQEISQIDNGCNSKNNYNTSADVTIQTSSAGNNIFTYLYLKKDTKRFKYFTGLHPIHFEALYEFLDPSIMDKLLYSDIPCRENKISYSPTECSLSNKDKLCLTLVRLRRGYSLQDLCCFTDMPRSHISTIFFTWVQFIYYQIRDMREQLFRGGRNIEKFDDCYEDSGGNNLNIVIHATEIPLQRSLKFPNGKTYEHPNTVKFLLGVCSTGALTYASEGFDGSISDKELFENSDISHFLEENDIVMADMDFSVQDISIDKNIKIYTSFTERQKDSKQKSFTTKIIGSRVHAKRAIRLMKSYRILANECPSSLEPLISNIFSVVSFLVNFEKCLVK